MNVLDPDTIRARRIALGLTAREVARKAKMTLTVHTNLERGIAGDEITARQVALLADVLACDPGDLYATRTTRASDDTRTIGALLAARPDATLDLVADALGWTLERAETALDALDQLLAPAGQRVHRTRTTVRITAAHTDPAVLTRLDSRRHHRRIPSPRELRLARQVALGNTGTLDRWLGAPENRLVRGRLINAGVLDPHHWKLTDDARFSLLDPIRQRTPPTT